MWLLRIVWFVILCVLGYSWFGGWGVALVILASIHFPSREIEYIEVKKQTPTEGRTLFDSDADYDPGYKAKY